MAAAAAESPGTKRAAPHPIAAIIAHKVSPGSAAPSETPAAGWLRAS
jgi:hypothetical protein